MATITAADLEISKKVWRVVYSVVQVDSFAEIREIDAEFVENLYTETLEEYEYEDVPNPEDVSWEIYDGVADDLRDVLHTGLCDALSGDGWTAPSYDEDCYLSAEWED